MSYGLGQQICLFAPVGDHTDTPENRAVCRDWLYDPNNAIPLMAEKLAASYRDRIGNGYSEDLAVMAALYRYNTGGWLPPSGRYAGNVGNYLQALERADVILEGVNY